MAVKYSAAGAVTSLYGLAVHRIVTGQVETKLPNGKQVAATVSFLVGMTWLATLL